MHFMRLFHHRKKHQWADGFKRRSTNLRIHMNCRHWTMSCKSNAPPKPKNCRYSKKLKMLRNAKLKKGKVPQTNFKSSLKGLSTTKTSWRNNYRRKIAWFLIWCQNLCPTRKWHKRKLIISKQYRSRLRKSCLRRKLWWSKLKKRISHWGSKWQPWLSLLVLIF